MKHKADDTQADRVGQVRIAFTDKTLTAWGGACSVLAKFLERISFREWVEDNIPVEEHSPNAKGIYPKVLSLLPTRVAGGHAVCRFEKLDARAPGAGGLLRRGVAAAGVQRSDPFRGQVQAETSRRTAGRLRRIVAALAGSGGNRRGRSGARRHGLHALRRTGGRQEGLQSDQAGPSEPSSPQGRVGLRLRRPSVESQRQRPYRPSGRRVLRSDLPRTARHAENPPRPGRQRVLRRGLPGAFGSRGPALYRRHAPERLCQTAIRQVDAWVPVAPGIEMAEARVRLGTWKRERRMAFVRQHVPTRPKAAGKQPALFADLEDHRDYRYGAMVANDEELSPPEVWRTCRPRAKIENLIRELKEGYGWHEFNVHSFSGTEATMLLIGMVGYNLIHHLNRRILKTESEALGRIKKIRLKVLAIPAIYGAGGRMPVLRLGVADKKFRARIRYWLRRIGLMELRLSNGIAVGALATDPA